MEMIEQINFYCDESRYLEHDKSRYMVLGMVFCPQNYCKEINGRIIELKKEFKINKDAETKWSKISKSRFDYYDELIDYFFRNNKISFRAVIIDKKTLNHKKFNQNHNDFYYKMMYYLISRKINPFTKNKIYLDEKDTHNSERARSLADILKNKYHDNNSNIIRPIQVIKSTEVQIMQLTDILIGAISYELNEKDKNNLSKNLIIEKIQNKINYQFKKKRTVNSSKFDLMFFKCKEQCDE